MFEKEQAEYLVKKEEFCKAHPELQDNSKASRAKIVHERKASKAFDFYWKQISQDVEELTYAEARARWKKLSEQEKVKFILEFIEKDKDGEKRITGAESLIVAKHHGLPKEPNEMYRHFAKRFGETKTGAAKIAEKGLSQAAEDQWKTLTASDKNDLIEDFLKVYDDWVVDLEIWIRRRPKEQHTILFNKFRKHFDPKAREMKRQKVVKSMSKFPYCLDKLEEIRSQKSNVKPAAKKVPETEPVHVGEPPYPSQTTAHYFMKSYEGNPHALAETYRRLDKKTKSKLQREMIKSRAKSMLAIKNYIKTLSPSSAAKYQKSLRKHGFLQRNTLTWHCSTGTDDEFEVNAMDVDSDSDS